MRKELRRSILQLALVFLLLAIIPPGWLPAQNTEFSYDGRVRSSGVPFDGDGLFKFAITNATGTVCYWSNDGVTLSGDEPTSSVQVQVSTGFFSVIIGDVAVDGMAPLDASIFNADERLVLRVWFSDGSHGFERLLPDRAIVNSQIIGTRGDRPIVLYVNPATGNDQFSGLKPERPKQTIQAAWNALPPLLEKDVQIHIASGVYREDVNLQGKSIVGDADILITGNTVTPTLVRITGALASNESVAVKKNGITVRNSRNITIEGLSFDSFIENGVFITGYSVGMVVKNCRFSNIVNTGLAVHNSEVEVDTIDCGLAASNATQYATGLYIGTHAPVVIRNSHFHNLPAGISSDSGRLSFGNNNIVSNCTWNGLYFSSLSFVSFVSTTGNVVSNCPIGLSVALNSVVHANRAITYSGNTQNLVLTTGGIAP